MNEQPAQPKTSQNCDPKRLDQFLRAKDYSLDDEALIEHLDGCPTCRQMLEEKAGDERTWSDLRTLLTPNEFDQADAVEYSAATLNPFGRTPVAVQDVLDALAPTDDPHHLGRLGTYEITGVIGVGGMGVVLKAVDPSLDRVVAIKVMAPHLANRENARKRFAREAKAAAAVLHPNVIPIHGVATDLALPYLVMAYIRGGSLQTRVERDGALPVVEILRIGSQIAAGLAAAHDQGLVHRDIKPENVLLEEGVERVTITDFGLARAVDDNTITQDGVITGTPMYMSPEQARGEQVDQQSDLFSLGSVLYFLSTGQAPYRADSTLAVMRQIIEGQPPAIRQLRPDIPDWLAAIIERLMSPAKNDRFASAREAHELLEACLSHVQQPNAISQAAISNQCQPRRATTPERLRKGAFSMKGLLISIVLFFAVCTIASPILYLMTRAETPPATKKSESEWLPQLAAAERITDSDARDAAYASVAKNAALAGDVLMTTRALERVVAREVESPTQKECVILLQAAGQSKAALDLAQSIYFQTDRDAAYAALAETLSGDSEAAAKIESEK